VRQSSGALPAHEPFARFPHELLRANKNMNRHIFHFGAVPASVDCHKKSKQSGLHLLEQINIMAINERK
jgi:hypothetical protein